MRVLILGGTTEASAIAQAVAGDARFKPVLSLAGRTRSPVLPPIPWRSGGFGGADGLAAYLRQQEVAALIDATHPFAVRIKANARQAAAAAGVAGVTVVRPPWTPQPGDRWTETASLAEAASALGPAARRVFLTVGQGELHWFGAPHFYLVRSVDPPADAPQGAVIVTARGPFSAADDQALMQAHRIDVLVTKNSGGSAVAGKLAAARALGVAVFIVARPPVPVGGVVTDAAGALDWLHAQAAVRGV